MSVPGKGKYFDFLYGDSRILAMSWVQDRDLAAAESRLLSEVGASPIDIAGFRVPSDGEAVQGWIHDVRCGGCRHGRRGSRSFQGVDCRVLLSVVP